ncbi:MAG: glycosyltransferase family 2 protein, partial [Rhodanobacteraceae bacterium]
EVGGFRTGYEGAQDHDLTLRISEQLEDREIIHIPKVLYHWRATTGSTAKSPDEKDYAASKARRAVEDHLRRSSIPGDVTHTEAGYLRVKYSLPETPPRVSLIIPTRDRLDLLRMSVGSILENTSYPDFEVIIVDNQSQEPETIAWCKEIATNDPRVRILPHDKPFNFSRINNDAVARASGEIIGLVNNDIEATDPGWLAEMVSHAIRPDVGAVGAKLYYPDGSIQHAGVILGFGGVAGHVYCSKPKDHAGQMGRAMLVQNMSAVTAACLVVRKEAYLAVGGMNEDLRVAFNDIDFCLRLLKAGYRNVWTPHAELIHHESASRGLEDTMEKQRRFASESQLMKAIWGEMLNRDPAYNTNLSLSLEPFTLHRV